MKKLVILIIILLPLFGCEEQRESTSCYLNYVDEFNQEQRLYVTQETFYSAVETPSKAIELYFYDPEHTIPANQEMCVNDHEIYIDYRYIEYTTSVYTMEPYEVDVKDVFHDNNGFAYITTNNHVFIELIGGRDMSDVMFDITEYIPLNEDEIVTSIKLHQHHIYLRTSDNRLFYVERHHHIESYHNEGITVHFVAENVTALGSTFYNTYILTEANNVYQFKKGIQDTYYLEQINLSNMVQDAVIDLIELDYNLYVITDRNDIYYCTNVDETSYEIGESIERCVLINSEVPFAILYDALSNDIRDIYYGDTMYYINTEDVIEHSPYNSPLNDTEELLYSYYYQYGSLITDEHLYLYDYHNSEFIDVLDIVPLQNGETIIDLNTFGMEEDEYILLRSDRDRVFVSNKIPYNRHSSITEFIDITDRLHIENQSIEQIETFTSFGQDSTELYCKVLLSNGDVIDIMFDENLVMNQLERIRPTILTADVFTFTYLDDLDTIFSPMYIESNLYLDQAFTIPIDFTEMKESPYAYDVLFHKPLD